MTYEVRLAVASDADRVAELHVSTWKETYAHLLPVGFFDDEHLRARRRMWDYILNNHRKDWSVYVASGAEAVHGTGVGQALLDAVLGESPAMLWVAAENPRAIAFYRRNGFEFDGVEKADPGAPLITDARMLR